MVKSAAEEAPERVPYWRLLAILASSIRIEPEFAYWLYDSALELHESGGERARLTAEKAEGELRSLEQHVLLGAIGGPGFEATLDTDQGKAVVRFLVTSEGLEEHRRRQELTSKLVN